MKPNATKALIFECPGCFTISCCHADSGCIDIFNSYQLVKEKQSKTGRRQ